MLIVGNSLFAESIAQILATSQSVKLAGTASTMEMALPLLNGNNFDAVVVAGTLAEDIAAICSVLVSAYPDLSIIRADLSTNKVQVITSRCIQARRDDFIAAVSALPKRGNCVDPILAA